MKRVYLYKSNKSGKKYCVVNGNKTIHFGASGYSDYTIHKDKDRMKRYTERHKNKENWRNMNSAGFWAKWILWNKPSLRGSITNTAQRFKIKIVNKSNTKITAAIIKKLKYNK
jgi:hypothetical protein